MASLKNLFVRCLHIPRKLRQLYYTRYNRFMFWLNDVKYGNNFQVKNSFYLKKSKGSIITIGDNFKFSSGDAFNPLSRNIKGCMFTQFSSSKIEIGNNTGISSACIWAKTAVSIGDNVNIGADCIIMDTDAHNLDYIVRKNGGENSQGYKIDSFSAASSPIIIEDDVLIGTRCIVLKGVKIGARSIIGSGSIVTKSIPSDCIAAGNPCRVIKSLNKPE